MASAYNETVSADADDAVSAIDDEEDHIEEKRAHVRAIFDTFDQERSGSLDASEVSHFVRCLGFKPTQRDLSRFLDQLVKDGSSRITFEHLFARLLAVSENGEWHFGQPIELERAFATLAPQGTISKEHLMNLLTSRGEALNASEMKELVGHIGVRRNGDVDWQGYIQQVVDYTRQNSPSKAYSLQR
ncbi:Caltractin [Toxocara canis]|uniref:Caltractin n=1 Tax=Toxocara canis TaxID=6265 RepID=A0A0B2UUF7_TOXCA|nr:Caltractin [Toxocara canis]